MKNDFSRILDDFDLQYYCDIEGVEYNLTRGKRGLQINVKECPHCGCDDWKVYLNQETGLGNCFHGDCEFKFNKFTFVEQLQKPLSKRAVVEHIKAIVNDRGFIPKATIRAVEEADVYASTSGLELPKSIALPFENKNAKYLINRGITNETTAYFKLRYAEKAWFKYLGAENEEAFQLYQDRIIIPVYNLDGELVSFQGRDMTGEASKKYLFPPGYASTGSILYNGHNAIGCTEICICEGAFDVMAVHQAFSENYLFSNVGVIGSFGKSLSIGGDESQLNELLKMREVGLKRITIMWDGEHTAIIDAINTASELNKYAFEVFVAFLPKDCDPNEVSQEVVRDAYSNAIAYSLQLKLKAQFKKV